MWVLNLFLVINLFGSFSVSFNYPREFPKPRTSVNPNFNISQLGGSLAWKGVSRSSAATEEEAVPVGLKTKRIETLCWLETLIYNLRSLIKDLWSWSEIVTTEVIKDFLMITKLLPDISRTRYHSQGTPLCNTFKTEKEPTKIFTAKLNWKAHLWFQLLVVLPNCGESYLLLWLTCASGWYVLYSCFSIKGMDRYGRDGCSLFITININDQQSTKTFTCYIRESHLVLQTPLKGWVSSFSNDIFWGFTYWCLDHLSCDLFDFLSNLVKCSELAHPNREIYIFEGEGLV